MANKRNKEEAMQRSHRRWALILILVGLQASACTHKSDMPSQTKPAKVEVVQGTDLSRVTLSPKAAERLDIKTGPLRDEPVRGRKPVTQGEPARGDVAREVVPTSAVLYDAKGKTSVYTNPEGLVFVRHAIRIDYI